MIAETGNQAIAFDGESASRFRQEAPRAWEEVLLVNRNANVEIESDVLSRTEEKNWREQIRRVVKICGKLALQETTTTNDEVPPKSHVDIINDRGAFMLGRDGEAPWSIRAIGATNDAATLQAIDRQGRMTLFWPWQIAEWSVPKMVASPGFQLKNAEKVAVADATLIKILFAYERQGADDPCLIREGWIVFDPARRWAIAEADVRLKSPTGAEATAHVTNQYKGSDDAIPVASQFSIKHVGNPREQSQTIRFTKYDRESVPESDFTLAMYGIDYGADPHFYQSPWFFLIAGITAVAVGSLMYRAVRSQNRDG